MFLQGTHGTPGNQRIAVHPQELLRKARLQLIQRAIQDIAALPGTYRHVFQLGFEVHHLGQRHPLGTAPLLNHKYRGVGIVHRRGA